MKFTTCVLYCTVVLAFVTPPIVAFEQSLSPNVLLQLYEEQLKSFAQVSFASSFTDYIEPNKDSTNTLQMTWKIDFDKKRYRKEIIEKNGGHGYDFSSIIDNETLSVSVYPDPNSGTDEISVTSYMKTPEDYWRRSIRMLYMSWPFGYFENGPHDISILETIRSAPKELFQDGAKVGLLCKPDDFEFKLWFDPSKNYVMEKIQVKRTSTPTSPVYFEFGEYVVHRFEQFDGRWFPSEYSVKESYPGGEIKYDLPPGVRLASDGETRKPEVLIANVALSDVKFSEFSDNDFQFKKKIPNGTLVYMQDVPQIQYIWMDGKIVPKTNELMLQIARGGHKFMPGVSEPRFWLMGIGIFLIVFAIGFKVYKKYKGIET